MTASNAAGRHAEVAGAGFAGLTAAIALAQRGWSVRVHERAPQLREFGAGIMLWENSIRVLEAIGAYGPIKEAAHAPPYYETRKDNVPQSYETFGDVRFRCPTRPLLHRSLLTAARDSGVDVVTGSPVAGATGDGELILDDGTRLGADLVVGADGVGSAVRDSLGFALERKQSQDGIIRLLVPRRKDELEQLEDANWDNVIDFWNFEPRVLRVLYVPCSADDLYLGLMAPHTDPRGSAVPLDYDWWVDVFPHLAPVLAEAAKINQARYDVYETTWVAQWTHGRVALVGDSAHAMTPSLAQGAGCAMMNGLSLAAWVDDADDIVEILPQWEAAERPVTDRVRELSAYFTNTRKMSEGNQFTDEVLATARHVPTGA